MWTLLAKLGLGLLNFANGSSFKSLAEAFAANAKAKAELLLASSRPQLRATRKSPSRRTTSIRKACACRR